MTTEENLKIVSEWITQLGKIFKCDLKINDEGGCSFYIGEDTIISILVSNDYPQIHLYSTLLSFPENNLEAAEFMMTRALELNFFQGATRGGSIASPPGGGSLIFCYNMPIAGNNPQTFAQTVDAFYETVINLRDVLLETEQTEIEKESDSNEENKNSAPTQNKPPLNWMKI